LEYIYTALLLHSTGQKISEANIKKVLTASGAKIDEAKVKALVSSLEGVKIDEVIKQSVISAAPVAAAPAEKKEKAEEKKDESPEMNWEGALKYCEELELAGHSDWRLPSIREIATLLDLSYKDSTWFHKEFFPDVKTAPLGFYWASTTYGDSFGWGVNFQFGYDGYYAGKKHGCYPFRPVRSIRNGYNSL